MNCLIIASGPSLTKEDVESTRGYFDFTIVVNDNYKICPWADLLYACDHKWWKYHKAAPEFTGHKVSPYKHTAKEFGLAYVQAQLGIFSPSYSIGFGNNSGHQALNLAVLLGFKDIVLLGFDCCASTGSHWFGDHPGAIHISPCYDGWVSDFAKLKRYLDSLQVNVTNCSRETAIKCFPRSNIGDYCGIPSA